MRREPPRLAAVRRDHVDLRLVVVLALGGERDPLAVGRPLRIAVLVAGREAARLDARRFAAPRMPVGNSHSSVVASLVSMSNAVTGGAGDAAVRRERRRCRCA